ncbi:MAG TPA: hypothetical protein VHM28_12580, partial [Anaerolineales bacterium]|nr:hypothetical protein [Anaerolineales bacterium]
MAELKTFQCPNCGSPVHVNGSEKQVKCEYCGTTVVVPEELREPEAPAATPIEINFGQMAPASDEIFKTVETVGKVTAGVTLVSAILPVVLTCVILAFVGGVLYFVFSSVGNIT